MLSVVMLSVVILNVVAPLKDQTAGELLPFTPTFFPPPFFFCRRAAAGFEPLILGSVVEGSTTMLLPPVDILHQVLNWHLAYYKKLSNFYIFPNIPHLYPTVFGYLIPTIIGYL